ncbi:MAG: glycosyltransferase [Candidatus Hydrogenedentes bacterium]|nr:glycosyltransferase [Candidatus Hydrogenedentota bacterium]
MAEIYAQTKIVVNACVNRDVNMRVFEGMASGALLVTDEADGLEDLFEEGKHLVVYHRDEDAIGLIERYLEDADARERIAAAGAVLVRAQHTYDLRMQVLVDSVAAGTGAGGYSGESRFRSGGYYANTRPEVAQFVPLGVRRLLDVGCGCGDFGRAIKQERGIAEVCGIEVVERAAAMARTVLDRVFSVDIEAADLPFDDRYFDCITFADVLEHLRDPGAVLRKAARVLADDGVMIMSIPNVRFYQVVAMLAEGGWEYAEAGILDRTHLRFFTARSMRKMVEDAELELLLLQPLSMAAPGDLPRRPDGSLQLGRAVLSPKDDADLQDLRTYQYLVIAGKPGADRLAKAREALNIQQFEAAAFLADQALGVDVCEQRRVIAAAMARLGRLKESETFYREALQARAEPAVEGELGILLVAMNRAGEARLLLECAVAANPNFDRAVGALGLVHLTEGRIDDAFSALWAAVDASFDHPVLVPHLIAAAEKLGRLDAIEDIVLRYMDFFPGNADLLYQGAGFLMKRGRLQDARERLETLFMLAPNHAAAADLLAQIERQIAEE